MKKGPLITSDKKRYKKAKTTHLKKLLILKINREIPKIDFKPLKSLNKPEIINAGEIRNLERDFDTLMKQKPLQAIQSNSHLYILVALSGSFLCMILFYLIGRIFKENNSKEFAIFLQIVNIFFCFILIVIIMALIFKRDQKLIFKAEKKLIILQSKWNRKFKNRNLKLKISIKNLKFFYEETDEEKINRFEKRLRLKEKFYKSEKKLPTIVEEENQSKIEAISVFESLKSEDNALKIDLPDHEGDCAVKIPQGSSEKTASKYPFDEEILRIGYNIGDCFSTDKEC